MAKLIITQTHDDCGNPVTTLIQARKADVVMRVKDVRRLLPIQISVIKDETPPDSFVTPDKEAVVDALAGRGYQCFDV